MILVLLASHSTVCTFTINQLLPWTHFTCFIMGIWWRPGSLHTCKEHWSSWTPMTSVPKPETVAFKINFNVILPSTLRYSKRLPCFKLFRSLSSSACYMLQISHPGLVHLNILWSSSLRNFSILTQLLHDDSFTILPNVEDLIWLYSFWVAKTKKLFWASHQVILFQTTRLYDSVYFGHGIC